MFNIKSLFQQCVLALVLVGAAAGASAGPTSFHVVVDTSRFAAQDNLISLQFGASPAAGNLSAIISNLTGNTNGVSPTGNVTVGANSFTMGNAFNADGNFADIAALFGGLFSFDIAFSGDYATQLGSEVSSLTISLLNTSYGILAGDGNGVGRFDIAQGAAISAVPAFAQFITISAITDADVPEPSQLLLMLAGLAIMGAMVRRQAQR